MRRFLPAASWLTGGGLLGFVLAVCLLAGAFTPKQKVFRYVTADKDGQLWEFIDGDFADEYEALRKKNGKPKVIINYDEKIGIIPRKFETAGQPEERE